MQIKQMPTQTCWDNFQLRFNCSSKNSSYLASPIGLQECVSLNLAAGFGAMQATAQTMAQPLLNFSLEIQ